MAIVVDPIYGRMKGKSGNVNFHIDRYGNQQARKNPDNSKRVASKKEKVNRGRFGSLEKLRKGFAAFYPLALDRSKINGRAMNCYFQHLNKDILSFSSGEYQVEYSRIKIGEGDLIPPEDLKISISGRELSFQWKPGPAENCEESIFIGIYNSELNTSEVSSAINRGNGRSMMQIPPGWKKDSLHIYSFARNDRGRVSLLNYYGEF